MFCVLQAFALLSLTLILASVALFCLETHEYFVDTKVIRTTEHLRNGSTKEVVKKVTEPKLYLWYIESVCVAWFCFEILVRFISCPNRWQFVKTPLNLIDFLAVLPFFFSFVGEYPKHFYILKKIFKKHKHLFCPEYTNMAFILCKFFQRIVHFTCFSN